MNAATPERPRSTGGFPPALARRRPLVIALTLAAVFGLAELPFASFMADDLIQLGVLEGVSPDTWTGPLQLYTISDGEPDHILAMKQAGGFPWFFDPYFKMAFFRPLSSGLLALDHAFFGLHPVGYRVHGALWFTVLVAGLGLLLRRVLPGPVGTLALVLFTISGIHGVLAWTATRHIVIAAALGVWALLMHVRWRQEGWRPGAALSVAGFALALCASEAAVAVVAYLVAYEALGLPGGTPRRRALALLPVGALVTAYLVAYSLLDLGSAGGSGYVNPLGDLSAFLFLIPGRLTFLLGAMVLGGNADVWVLRPDLRTPLIAIGAVAVGLAALLLRVVWARMSSTEHRSVTWLIAGGVAAAVPFVGTPIGSRCLVIPLIGGAVAIAVVLHRWWRVLRRRPGLPNRLLGALCIVLALIHLVLAPIQRLAAAPMLQQLMVTRLATAMDEAELGDGDLSDVRVIVLAAPDIAVGFHAFFYRALHRMPMPQSWWALSWAPCDHRFHRTADDTLEMELVDGSMEGSHLHTGKVIELDGMRAEVLQMGRIGPSRVEFTFDVPLDDPSLRLLAWGEGRLKAVTPPPVGESILVPWEPTGTGSSAPEE